MTYAISIENLKKFYGKRQALKDATLNVPSGTICGLLGPNGAGKSTLIKTLVGVLRPSSGKVEVLGGNPLANNRLQRLIGYMPQAPALYEDLSAYENIAFFGQINRVANLHQKIDDILFFTELSSRAHDAVYTFSGGMKKRISLACALIHNPQIVFLDEPTAAVDPHLKLKTWELFKKLAQQGVTLFVSTHLMDEALLCDRLAIIDQGSIIAYDKPETILEKGHSHVVLNDGQSLIEEKVNGRPQDLAKALHKWGLKESISSVKITHDSLEHIILTLLKEKNEK